ncbi:hypothetical protein KFU94_06335 [Chloroflexi bacterium TSY]|nr:hypothetical protein [Chloroflexi bacterium TSY]
MVSLDKARQFVHTKGALWERALFEHLFFDGSIERVHQCLLCYKNADGGWGHGLEHDIRCPMSNPLALEFLLGVIRDTNIDSGSILTGAMDWLVDNQAEDGELHNPPDLLEWPHKPWWSEGGQNQPDSITGNLVRLGERSNVVEERTKRWVLNNLTLDKIQANEWLFMAYHAYDYFMSVDDFPDIERYRSATIDNVVQCAQNHRQQGEHQKLFSFFQFGTTPDSPLIQSAPAELTTYILDHLETTQREDGGWDDEHNLDYWQPYFSTVVLLTLKNFGRL